MISVFLQDEGGRARERPRKVMRGLTVDSSHLGRNCSQIWNVQLQQRSISEKSFKLNGQITFILTASCSDDIEGLDFKIPEVDLDVPDIDYKVEDDEIEISGLDL